MPALLGRYRRAVGAMTQVSCNKIRNISPGVMGMRRKLDNRCLIAEGGLNTFDFDLPWGLVLLRRHCCRGAGRVAGHHANGLMSHGPMGDMIA